MIMFHDTLRYCKENLRSILQILSPLNFFLKFAIISTSDEDLAKLQQASPFQGAEAPIYFEIIFFKNPLLFFKTR
mgnify:CR=1 FL=1